MCLQEDLHISLDDFRGKFGDVPQKGDLTLLCPLMDDPTEKVGSCSSSSSSSINRAAAAACCVVPAGSGQAYRAMNAAAEVCTAMVHLLCCRQW
jgi:hypothetical protein